MKILIMGGMHGNEPLGIELVRKLEKCPIDDVDTVLANQPAVAANRRFTDQDLNRSFPGSLSQSSYTLRRAAELVEFTKGYDVVLDFHNTHCPDNDCSFVGMNAHNKLYELSSILGLRRVIVADYDCLNKYAPNCISIEISLGSPLMDVWYWYNVIARLAKKKPVGVQLPVETYRFVYRMTLADKERLNLETYQLEAFKPLPTALADELGVVSPAFPIFIGDAYTPYNYGGILNKYN